MSAFLDIFSGANVQWVLIGSLLLGFASGVIGSFVLLKKQSLISDAMAHAALPGVCIMYIIFEIKSVPLFLVGATITSLIATHSIQAIIKHSRVKSDAAIGIIISVFFGFGIVLLTYIQQNSSGNQAGLDSFIFGQAASLVRSDVELITIGAFILVIITALFFKEFKLTTFDPQFAQGIGLPVSFLNGLLLALVVGVVVIGIQMVGVVLIAALLITPPLAARYWTENLGVMAILGGIFGALSGASGAILSTVMENLPTGPMMVLSASTIFFLSLLFGSKKGIALKAVRQV
ncbi:metal ABC transporter permease [Aquibacillus koreensis]|uniref:Metal ABC transporter permease n=1 Tax=Aquibacillus koreensis TaxID=279446 RepID=A0A9X3WI96_9BACI|nr:metal ABC transporter permease [Aquibacillus koreensis]MCT2535817.1 metal ABC transporter permease [Aquibacillus koreensis]MDC3420272.1 metal ABC transporter permease [Aquibacillus koreensis]